LNGLQRLFALQIDYLNHAVRRIDLSDNSVTTLAGSPTQSSGHADGVGTLATFNRPLGIALNTAANFAVIVSLSDAVAWYAHALLDSVHTAICLYRLTRRIIASAASISRTTR